MPVVTNAVYQIHPGRQADVIAHMSRARAIHERLGAQAAAVQAIYGGPNSLRVNYLLWFPDLAAFGRYNDDIVVDADWQKFVQEVLQAPSPAATLLSNSVAEDFGGLDTTMPERFSAGTVLSTTSWQPHPGRTAEVAADIMAWRAVAANHGLTTRSLQTVVAGPLTGLLTVAITFPSWSAYVESNGKLLADPAFQVLFQRVLGPGSASVALGQTIGVFLPI